MSWISQMDSHYVAYPPCNNVGTFMDFSGGLTYDHVNFSFSSSSQWQDGAYSPVSMGYKYGYLEPLPTQYFSNSPSDAVFNHFVGIHEHNRRDVEFPFTGTTVHTRATNHQFEEVTNHQSEWTINQQSERLPNHQSGEATNHQSEGVSNTNTSTRNQYRPRSHYNSQDYEAVWQDDIDPDHMSYEELLELGEAVGKHSRGLPHEQISLLPVSKFKCCFLRRKSRSESCVICQMEYKRGARLISLPCKHKYHLCCGTKWLSINKACPICYTEVSIDATS